MKKVARILFPILTLGMAAVILGNSARPGNEAAQTTGFVADCIEAVIRLFAGDSFRLPPEVRSMVPKLGHLAEFSAFSLFLSASVASFRGSLGRFGTEICWIGVFLALTDEHLQAYVPGRGSRVSDVLIDLSGVFLGFWLAKGCLALHRRRKLRTEQNPPKAS